MDELSFDDYQSRASQFAKYGDIPDYPFIALSEEAGEVLGKLAKYCRNNQVSLSEAIQAAKSQSGDSGKVLFESLTSELGDLLWQLQQACYELDIDFSYIARSNITKLEGRSRLGTLIGEGDNR